MRCKHLRKRNSYYGHNDILESKPMKLGKKGKCPGALLTLLQSKKQYVRDSSWESPLATWSTQWVWSPMSTIVDIPLDHSLLLVFFFSFLLAPPPSPQTAYGLLWWPIRTVAFCTIAFPFRCHLSWSTCTTQWTAGKRWAWTPSCMFCQSAPFFHTLSIAVLKANIQR